MKCIARLQFFALVFACASAARAESVAWVRQLGTPFYDFAFGVSADGLGNVFITGSTSGVLDGANAGDFDAYVSKYNAAGTRAWSRQFGTPDSDRSNSAAADGLGNVYISGYTTGAGGVNAGDVDAFLRKYNSAGTLLWSRLLGTPQDDEGAGLAVDGLGNVFVTGVTTGSLGAPHSGGDGTVNAFVSKYDSAGGLLWSRQSALPWGNGVSVDELGNVYMAGTCFSIPNDPLSGTEDAYVNKYDTAGNLLWTRELDSLGDDSASAIAADGLGNIYIAGGTTGGFGGVNAGFNDAYVAKYSNAGTLLWTRQFGTTTDDSAVGVTTDSLGNVYISGSTTGNLAGASAGGTDAFVRKYSPAGELLWTRQLGTVNNDSSAGITDDGQGSLYLAGLTSGDFGAHNSGNTDAFLVKIVDPVPEPSSVALAAMGILGLVGCMKRRVGKTTQLPIM